MQHNKVWQIKPHHPKAKEYAQNWKVSPLTANLLLNRQIKNDKQGHTFLNPKLTHLQEPLNLSGVKEAVEIIAEAISKQSKITIYGDYDVDGITSTSILLRLFELFGISASFYIPHRIEEGYGLNNDSIKQIAEDGTELLITVDCGICAVKEVEFARSLGMKVIITDHHRPFEILPDADAIVHPCLSEDKNTCAGAMVAFKLAWAVANHFKSGEKVNDKTRQFLLDCTVFAALGTVADVMDLTGENRIITSFGLGQLQTSELIGIKALIDVAGLKDKKLFSSHISFDLAPMLNAAGRMGHSRLAVELLTSQNQLKSYQIAQYLKEQNVQRRKYERDIFKKACEIISMLSLDHPDRRTIVLSSDQWHQGVIGIVAARLADKYLKPAILINTANGQGTGSGRSIEGFDILKAIEACSEHLVQYGGHQMAAGVTIQTEKINDFANAFEEFAVSNISSNIPKSILDIDALCQLNDFNHHIVREIQMLEPFGQGNPKPVFASKGVRLLNKPRKIGTKGDHIELALADNTGTMRAVGFNMAGYEKKLIETDFFNVAYEPKINTFNGNYSVELILADIQFE